MDRDAREAGLVGVEPIDPDPFTIAAVSIAGAALIIQLVQTAKQFSSKPTPVELTGESRRMLRNLDRSTLRLRAAISDLNELLAKAGQKDVFADAPFRVDAASLMLRAKEHEMFEEKLRKGYASVGLISRWVNRVIREQPELAARLGARISDGLEDSARKLNAIMAKPGPNIDVTTEAYNALFELERAISEELRGGRGPDGGGGPPPTPIPLAPRGGVSASADGVASVVTGGLLRSILQDDGASARERIVPLRTELPLKPGSPGGSER
jgi:hypothetical protein